MTDVIDFTKIKQKREEEKLVELTQEYENDQKEVAEIATMATMEIVDAMIQLGYDVADKPGCIKDILGVIEAVRALGYRAKGLESPIHEVNNTLYGFVENEASLLEDFIADMNDNIED
jgi:FMN phosphatase YigB (HAD superfamily)